MKISSAIGMFLLAGCMVASAQDAQFDADKRQLLSRLQAMSHGYYSQDEWTSVFNQLQNLKQRAQSRNAHTETIELTVLEGMILSDLRGEHARALEILNRTKTAYFGQPVDNVKRLYVKLADVHARLGDEAAIGRLIEEFKRSPHFDPDNYAFEVGPGRDTPMTVVRPFAGSDSITVSAMEKFRTQARYAPGKWFPEFQSNDMDGHPLWLTDYRGRVVLVDFWFPEWTAWRRDLPYLVSLYRQYQPHGFEIVGVYLRPDSESFRAFVRDNGMTWRQIVGDRRLASQLGVFGEARNFLIDQNGVIVGRDLRGSDLAEAVRNLL